MFLKVDFVTSIAKTKHERQQNWLFQYLEGPCSVRDGSKKQDTSFAA